MKWFSRLFNTKNVNNDPIDPHFPEPVDTEGKHVIRIMVQDKEVVLVFSDEEFANGLKRGQALTQFACEE